MIIDGRVQLNRLARPFENSVDLVGWVQLFSGLGLPWRPVCPHHDTPLDYLHHTYFEHGDVIVWAPRGGGKTRLAALATLFDLLHKPGCSVRILGGTLDQSLRMWEHLLPGLTKLAGQMIIGGGRHGRRVSLANGSDAAVLTQSQHSIRGVRVQKLRCDEVDLFEPEIWQAAQLVTRSKEVVYGDSDRKFDSYERNVRGSIEALSTFHRPYGPMSQIIEQAAISGTRVIKWCLLDVLEKCPPERECAMCPLWEECQGIAKTKCHGFFSIDDAIVMKQRVSQQMWETEMLCKRPSSEGCVFPSFDPAIHVLDEVASSAESELSLAMDFGFANPLVCLWIRSFKDGITHVIDEYYQPMRTVSEHLEQIECRPYGKVRKVACDPAGAGRNDQTAASNITLLKSAGYLVRTKGSKIVDGLEMIRAALKPAFGPPKLFIHSNCKRLIRALQSYHYPPGGGELPVKDGEHDHLIDAMRYYFVNRSTGTGTSARRY